MGSGMAQPAGNGRDVYLTPFVDKVKCMGPVRSPSTQEEQTYCEMEKSSSLDGGQQATSKTPYDLTVAGTFSEGLPPRMLDQECKAETTFG